MPPIYEFPLPGKELGDDTFKLNLSYGADRFMLYGIKNGTVMMGPMSLDKEAAEYLWRHLSEYLGKNV